MSARYYLCTHYSYSVFIFLFTHHSHAPVLILNTLATVNRTKIETHHITHYYCFPQYPTDDH